MWTAQDRERYKDDGRRYPSDLADAEWALVRPLVETYPTLTKDLREMVNGCLYLAAEGCRWRSLPKEFGSWQTVRGYWDRFRRDGLWADAAALLTPAARARLGKSPAPSTGIVDSQSVVSGPQTGQTHEIRSLNLCSLKRQVWLFSTCGKPSWTSRIISAGARPWPMPRSTSSDCTCHRCPISDRSVSR